MSDAPDAPVPPEVQPALARFERGDFAGASAELRALLACAPAPDLEQAARALLGRMALDPWTLRVGLGALGLLALLAGLYVR